MSVVAQAGTLAEAREALAGLNGSVDLALLDLNLPDGEGTGLIGNLRAANPHAQALVLTPHSSERGRLARTMEAGAAGVLSKAAGVEEIVDAIRRLYSGEQ